LQKEEEEQEEKEDCYSQLKLVEEEEAFITRY
jgi:hypothetical protein